MKKLFALLLSAILAFSCAACGAEDGENAENDASAPKGEASSAQNGEAGDGGDALGLTMSVNRDTGKLSVRRMALPSRSNEGEAEKWTIFVYLCGTDLESEDAAATGDLLEMIDGASGAGVRFVVETGGAEEWQNSAVDADKLQRYLVENGDAELVDEQSLAGMGRASTFTDFLRWGVENYASEHMGVVLWNHGGGSIAGVCFDETENNDSLSLRELDASFLSVCGGMGRKFDFVGFDACLMGTLETANVLATYADYMIASEEMEPGSGWDYTAIGRYLGANPDADTVQLGIVVCDSFLEACREIEDDEICTLAVIDLSKLDALLVAFNDFAHGMYDAAGDSADCAAMMRGIGKADNFGGNNKSEGYTNMVDMGGIISACEPYAEGAKAALAALRDVVAYSISGTAHEKASGLSLYYPLKVEGSEELSVFSEICPSPYYISFVDRQSHGSVNADDYYDYDDDSWFDDDGEWFWGLLDGWLDEGDYDDYENYDRDDGGEWFWSLFDDWDDDWDNEDNADDYWNYYDSYEQTGESPYITFAVEPQLDENGNFCFEFDDAGYDAASDVYGLVYELSADGEDFIELGETYDLQGGWDTGAFADDFDGWWLSLPDGQNLATYIVERTENYTIYTSPIELNGEETNLRIKLDYDAGKIVIEGAWDGMDESGALSRSIVKLKEGDVITPMYYAYALEGDDEYYYYGQDYTFTGEPEVCYDIMEDGEYYFAFCIDDIYGDYYMSDVVHYTIEDGEVYYSEE